MRAPVTGGDGGPPRELPPPGKYIGVCNGVYMLGTQPGYQGGDPKPQVMLTFELHKRRGPALDGAGRPLEASKIETFSFNPKANLVEIAGKLRGQSYAEEELAAIKALGGFDVESLLGQACWLEIEHRRKADGSTGDKISSFSSLDPEDDTPPSPVTDHVYWDWTTGSECPRRIAWFWARARENPAAEPAPAGGPALPPLPTGAVDLDSVPF